MPATPDLYLALSLGVTGRTDAAPPVAMRYFLASDDAAADVELRAMRADPAFPLYQDADLVDVAAVANPVPLPRRLRWVVDGEVREYIPQLVPMEEVGEQ
jgi:hypothetical protein